MSIARSTFYNLGGAAAAMIVALVTVPFYLHVIGDARYGVLAIVWLFLGYFGLFDLGLSRATANEIARLGDAAAGEREGVFWTALTLNVALGIVGGAVLYAAGLPLLSYLVRTSGTLREEVLAALPFLAAAVPFVTAIAVLTGALEARSRFGVVNSIQATSTVFFQVVPLGAAYLFGPQLQILIPAAIAARVFSSLLFVPAIIRFLPIVHKPRFQLARVRGLFGYGGWITITNVIGPVMTSVDRFLIGAISGAAAVAYYTVPYGLSNRVLVIPGALSRTLFPRFSSGEKADGIALARGSVTMLHAVMTPVVVVGLFLMEPFLRLWVGSAFAAKATPVGEIILLGVWINGLTYVPFMVLQGQRRPDLVAKIHMAELLPYAALLWGGLQLFGIAGAAAAWTIRVALDGLLQFWIAGVGDRTLSRRLLLAALIILAAWFVVAYLPDLSGSLWLHIFLGVLLTTSALWWSWASSLEFRRIATGLIRLAVANRRLVRGRGYVPK